MILTKIKNKIRIIKNKKIKPDRIKIKSEYTNLKHLETSDLYFNNEFALKYLKDNLHAEILNNKEKKTIYHCYWYGLITEKQIFSIKSALLTQKNAEVWLWIDTDTWKVNINNPFINLLKGKITVKEYNPKEEISDTQFNKLKRNFLIRDDLALRSDAFRMLVLSKYKGLYFDLDILFLRDFTPLFNNKGFLYQWEQESYGNSAILYLKDQQLINNLSQNCIKKNTFIPWIAFYYGTPEIKDLTVLPCAFFDPIWNITDEKAYNYPITKFEDFFKKTDCNIKSMSDFFPGCYTYHWHNLWKNKIEEDSLFDIFDKELNEKLGIK